MKNKRTKSGGGARDMRGDHDSTTDTGAPDINDDDIDVGSPEQQQLHHQTSPTNSLDGIRVKTEEAEEEIAGGLVGAPPQPPPSAATQLYPEMFGRLSYPFQSKLFNPAAAAAALHCKNNF